VRCKPFVEEWKAPKEMKMTDTNVFLLSRYGDAMAKKKMPPHGWRPALLSVTNSSFNSRQIVQTLRIHPMAVWSAAEANTVHHDYSWTEKFDYETIRDRFVEIVYTRRKVNPTSGCGFPFDLDYSKRQAFVDDRQKLWSVMWYTWCTVMDYAKTKMTLSPFQKLVNKISDLVSYFLKEEPMKLAKHVAEIWRGIKPSSIRMYLMHMLLMYNYLDEEYADWQNSAGAAGMSTDPAGMKQFIEFILKHGLKSGDDASGYEDSVTFNDILKYLMYLGYKFGKVTFDDLMRNDTDEEIYEYISSHWSLWFRMICVIEISFADYLVYIPNGDVVDRKNNGTTMSGKLTTGFTNKCTRGPIQRTAWAYVVSKCTDIETFNRLAYEHPEWFTCTKTMNQGDDIVHNCPTDEYIPVCAMMGKTIKEYSNMDRDGYVDFVSMRWYPNGTWEFLGEEKVVVNFSVSEQKLPQWMAMIQLLGDKVFDWPGCPITATQWKSVLPNVVVSHSKDEFFFREIHGQQLGRGKNPKIYTYRQLT
jgi:hypothetical protein